MHFRNYRGKRVRLLGYPGVDMNRTNVDTMVECRLWRHVLIRAIMDAASRRSKDKLEIARWMTSTDFDTVCEYSAVEPDLVFERIRAVLVAKWPVSFVLAMQLKDVILKDDPDWDLDRVVPQRL